MVVDEAVLFERIASFLAAEQLDAPRRLPRLLLSLVDDEAIQGLLVLQGLQSPVLLSEVSH